jgi:hypothetical protein
MTESMTGRTTRAELVARYRRDVATVSSRVIGVSSANQRPPMTPIVPKIANFPDTVAMVSSSPNWANNATTGQL